MIKLYEVSPLNFVSNLAAFEVRSAIRRREFEGDLIPADANTAIRLLDAELVRVSQIEMNSVPISSIAGIIDRHRLRALDAIQLASALLAFGDHPEVEFVSADVRLLRAAESEGLAVLDPTAL